MALNINGTTGISGVDGSVSAPAVTGTDSNTGITFPSADTIKFATGGVERFGISNSGLSGDGSGLTGIQAGITMADSWKMSQSVTYNSNNYLTSSWVRQTGTLGGNVGSAMTESSGVFTFPGTGLYYVELNVGFYHGSAAGFLGIQWYLSTDGGSSTSQVTSGYVGGGSGAHYDRLRIDEFFDVTHASNFQISFQLVLPGQTTVQGGDGRTTLKVVKYGET